MHCELINSLKLDFCNEFFTIILSKMSFGANKCGVRYNLNFKFGLKNNSFFRVYATNIGEDFSSMLSRTFNVFFLNSVEKFVDEFQDTIDGLDLESWQISAIVHDGSKELAEFCQRINIPEY